MGGQTKAEVGKGSDKRLRTRSGKAAQQKQESLGDRKLDHQRNLRPKNCIGQQERKEVLGEEGREGKQGKE